MEEFAAQHNIKAEDLPDVLFGVAAYHHNSYTQSGRRVEIDAAIYLANEGMNRANSESPSFARLLNALGVFLKCRYDQTGEIRDLEDAIGAARQAVDCTPHESPERAAFVNDLGNNLARRYECTGKMADLEMAIEAAREAVHSTPHDGPFRGLYLNNLGSKLAQQYERTGKMDTLEEAIGVARQAVDSTPHDRPNRLSGLNNLGNILEIRYKRTGEMEDLENALKTVREAVESTPPGHPNRASGLNYLEYILGIRYERKGEIDDLKEAIRAAREVVKSTPYDHPNQALYLNNLGNKLAQQYTQTGEIGDLEEATRAARKAVDSTPHGHLNQAMYLINLGSKLVQQYQRTGEIETLEEAIRAARQAVDFTPHDHPDKPHNLSNLGNMLEIRYKRTGEMNDIEEAIKAAREAVNAPSPDYLSRPMYLNNLGSKLESRYERKGEIDDIKEAIRAAREVVDSTPNDHPNYAMYLSNLGGILAQRHEQTGDRGDLEEAIGVARKAVDSTPHDHPDRPSTLNNLGNMLESQYKLTGEMDDLENAIKAAREAVDSTPHDHSERAGMLNNLGNKHTRRYERTTKRADLNAASIALQEAARSLSAVPFHRVRAAAACLRLLALQGKISDGVLIGELALDLIPAVHTRLLDRSDQQFVLSTFAGVASDLCALLLSAGRSHDALQCLERGRAVMISQLLDERSDLSVLSRDFPTLAAKYESLVIEVNSSFSQKPSGEVARHHSVQRRREAVTELNACMQEIRAVSGQERFLLGQTVAEMQECASEGYIIVVNVTALRSDAIIVSQHTIETLPLLTFGPAEATRWLCKRWFTNKRSEQQGLNDEYSQYLSWLWHACVKHVLDRVATDQIQANQEPARVWWIGCGLASSMPFHAAGLHVERSTENAYSKVVSSYTPSIKALFHAREQAKCATRGHAAQDQMLIATMPTTPESPSVRKAPSALPEVLREKDEILEAAASNIDTCVLLQPSVEQVLHVLPQCRIAHFACHGTSDHADPSNSGLILQKTQPDGTFGQDFLSVYRLSQSRTEYAQIAYLSACSTAENKGARLSDEVIHVVSGFQVAGFPHVVGCLWPAGDSECVEVAKEFYTSIFSGGQPNSRPQQVASALQHAVMAVRAADLSMPLNWAQFVHFGA